MGKKLAVTYPKVMCVSVREMDVTGAQLELSTVLSGCTEPVTRAEKEKKLHQAGWQLRELQEQ